jgi:hypothetical protein
MSLFRKKPVVVEAITFDELVEIGRAQGVPLYGDNQMPWSFTYGGRNITHETDGCYLIPTLEGTMRMDRGDMLITGVKGEIYPCKPDIFTATYESAAPQAQDPDKFLRDMERAREQLAAEGIAVRPEDWDPEAQAKGERDGADE